MKSEYIDHFAEASAWLIYSDSILKKFGDVPMYYYSLIRWNEEITLAEEAE